MLLLCIAFVNLALWFFVVTHQTRFLLSTLVVLAILSAIAFSGLRLMNLKSLIIILFVLTIGNYFIHVLPGSVILKSLYGELLVVDLGMRKAFMHNPNWNGWKEPRIEFEKYIISKSSLIYKYNGNFLFKVNN